MPVWLFERDLRGLATLMLLLLVSPSPKKRPKNAAALLIQVDADCGLPQKSTFTAN